MPGRAVGIQGRNDQRVTGQDDDAEAACGRGPPAAVL